MATWTITSLGHAGFRIETGGQVLLIDPWLRGNPAFPEDRFDEAVAGATHILLSHGHGDHAGTALEIREKTGATLIGIVELIAALGFEMGAEGAVAMNKGGTVALGDPVHGGALVEATLVNAVHSNSAMIDGKLVGLGGGEGGWMIRSGGETLYFMGDTDVFADMEIFQDLHQPRIGIVPIGGHFTMDARRAAYACKKFFDFDAIIPCHYATFPMLAQTADDFIAQMDDALVIPLQTMESRDL